MSIDCGKCTGLPLVSRRGGSAIIYEELFSEL